MTRKRVIDEVVDLTGSTPPRRGGNHGSSSSLIKTGIGKQVRIDRAAVAENTFRKMMQAAQSLPSSEGKTVPAPPPERKCKYCGGHRVSLADQCVRTLTQCATCGDAVCNMCSNYIVNNEVLGGSTSVTQLNSPSFEMAKALALGSALMGGGFQEEQGHTPWLTMLDQFMDGQQPPPSEEPQELPEDQLLVLDEAQMAEPQIPAAAPEEPESFALQICRTKKKPPELDYVEKVVPKSVRRSIKADDVSARWTFLDNRLCVELTNKLFGDDRILYVSAAVEPNPQPMGLVGPRTVECLPLFAEADELLLQSKELRLLIAMVCSQVTCHLGEIVMTLGEKQPDEAKEANKKVGNARKRRRSSSRRPRHHSTDDEDWDPNSDSSVRDSGAAITPRNLPKRRSRRPPKRLGIDDDTVSDYTSDIGPDELSTRHQSTTGPSRAASPAGKLMTRRSGARQRARPSTSAGRRAVESEVNNFEDDDDDDAVSVLSDRAVLAAARRRKMRASANIWPPGLRPVGNGRPVCMIRGKVVLDPRLRR
ncbi:hypothetical protein FOL47_001921 [Perkinsus chesapeaki]|uniref:Uncharacterized protein n=1 Tax=Perkinsus chesapeaki TaxID=330153 RepID=A0A7J6MG79_PERCH|nr:hypothetical protein FOL47_001921 [Perkinsus chesapeaki]